MILKIVQHGKEGRADYYEASRFVVINQNTGTPKQLHASCQYNPRTNHIGELVPNKSYRGFTVMTGDNHALLLIAVDAYIINAEGKTIECLYSKP